MKTLAARTKRQLLLDTGKWGHCAIYEDQLQCIWPRNEENRKRKNEQFAKEYGLLLSFYRPGLCAIFETERHRSEFRSRGSVSRFFGGQTIAQQRKDFEATVSRLEATDRQQRMQIEALTVDKPARQVAENILKLVMLFFRFVLFARDVGRNRANENQDKVVPPHFAWPYVMNSSVAMHRPLVSTTWIWHRQHARWHHAYYRTRR